MKLDNDQKGVLAFVAFVALMIFAMIVFGIVRAHAHDHNRPDLTPWFETLQSKSGTPCCDGKDGTSLDDPDWGTTDDQKHFKVRLDGKWYNVPDNAVVMDQNRAGHAVVWTYPMRGWGGDLGYGIRCFMPGTFT